MTNCVGYTRVSSQGQVSGDGHPRQEQSISDYARRSEMIVVQFFNEDAVPGKSEMTDRPKFQEMIAYCLANDAKTIVVEALDRLAREYRVQEQLLIYLASKGLALIAANTGENVTEALMGDPMRRALVQIQGILAELDKNMIVSKLLKARQRTKQKSGMCEGQPPYGYRTNRAERKRGESVLLIPIPQEQCVIELARVARIAGKTYEEIAKSLNSAGPSFATRHGKPWTATQVRRMLTRLRLVSSQLQELPGLGHPESSSLLH